MSVRVVAGALVVFAALPACASPLGDEIARAAVDPPVVVEHLGGSADPSASVALVLVPHGWATAAAFRARARRVVTDTLRQDWFRDHTADLSFWLAWDPERNRAPFRCRAGMTDRAVSAIDHLWGPARAATYDFGGGSQGGPDRVVALLGYDCYAFSVIGGDSAVGSAAGPSALAHELAHAIAGVHDEYSFAGNPNGAQSGARSCIPAPNLATVGREPWRCLVEAQATCPSGESVGTYGDGLGCPGMARPCQSCQMRYVTDGLAFCPVCRAALDAGLARILARDRAETCNGADDDADGWSDEGCGACAPGRDTPVHEPPCSSLAGGAACAGDATCTWLDAVDLCLPVAAAPAAEMVARCAALGDVGGCENDATVCAWYDCVGACLPRGTAVADVCAGAVGCWTSGTLSSCDARADGRCAWFACANACLPVESRGVPGCESLGL